MTNAVLLRPLPYKDASRLVVAGGDMRKRNIGWRIDYILAASALASRAASCRVLAEVGTSDHAPVLAEIS